MIGKFIKFFIKLGFGLAILVVIIILCINYLVRGTEYYFKSNELPYDHASYVIEAHQVCEEYPVGTVHMCAICRKNFTKKSMNQNTCCPEHEKTYQELYKAWGRADRGKVESLGFKFK